MQPPREELWGGDVGPNDVKRIVTKSGHRISLNDKQGKNAIVIATPEHVKLSLMESSNETGNAMLSLHSDGDVFLSAPAGRIHFHSKYWSREVGGAGGAAQAAPKPRAPVTKPALAPNLMAMALKEAHKNGSPFCEICEKKLLQATSK